MNNVKLLTLAIAVLAVACDPYSKVPGGAASVAVVSATSGSRDADGVPVDATAAGGVYTIEAASTCTPPSGATPFSVGADQSLVFVWFDRQIDGATVQTSLTDCTPVGSWLTASPAAPAGSSWYSCYYPTSPAPYLGGAIVMFQAPEGGVGGWGGFTAVPADNDAYTTFSLSGSLLTTYAVDRIDVHVAPNPGDVSELTFAPTTTSVAVTWSAAGCAAAGTTYRIERAPNVPGAPDEPGDYTLLADGLTALTYTDSGLTEGTKYWYRVKAVTTSLVVGSATEHVTGAAVVGNVTTATASP